MLYTLHYTEQYREDVLAAYDWYYKVNKELSAKFIDELKEGEELILENPKANGRVFKSKFRRYLTPVFPYKIIYRIQDNSIYVIALIHLSRSNRFIKRKLK